MLGGCSEPTATRGQTRETGTGPQVPLRRDYLPMAYRALKVRK
jgi:hypothetical protein